jgi:hypothetical protein
MATNPITPAIRLRILYMVLLLVVLATLVGGPDVLTWLTHNSARITTNHRDPSLRSIRLDLPPEAAAKAAAERLAVLRGWTITEPPRRSPDQPGSEGYVLRATRTTRLWRFVDDIGLEFRAASGPGGTGTEVTGSSRSRVGKGDFGQNARNLREALRAIRTLSPTPGNR